VSKVLPEGKVGGRHQSLGKIRFARLGPLVQVEKKTVGAAPNTKQLPKTSHRAVANWGIMGGGAAVTTRLLSFKMVCLREGAGSCMKVTFPRIRGRCAHAKT